MKTRVKMSGIRQYGFCAALIGLGMTLGASPAVAATLTAGNASGSAGTTVPVTVTLDAGSAHILNFQFALVVVAQGGAPAIAEKLTYAASTPSPGAPGLKDDATLGQILIGYPSDLDPTLTGTIVIGTLSVPIPAGATGTYQVQVNNPSALDPDANEVPITGAPGTITIAVAPTDTPTVTPTNTPLPPTITPTHAPATLTPTRVPPTITQTPKPGGGDDDGCQIVSMRQSRSGWLVLLPLAGLLWVRRRAR
jgi:hypothetical protein